MQWNLIAQNRSVRDKFFFALQAILHPASASSSSSSSASKRDNVVTRGSMLTRWFGEGADASCESVFLFHESDGTKYGSLYWNAKDGDRTKSAQCQLPLHTVKDVYMGKNTRTTRSPRLDAVPKDVLFSLVASPSKDSSSSAPASLNLQARDAAARTEFVHALKGFWKTTSVSSIKAPPLTPAQAGPAGGYGAAAEVLQVPFHVARCTCLSAVHVSPHLQLIPSWIPLSSACRRDQLQESQLRSSDEQRMDTMAGRSSTR
jgi:hypothetical protein